MSQTSGTAGLAWRGASQEMTSETCARGRVVLGGPSGGGGGGGRGGRTLTEAVAQGQDLGPFLGEFPAASALPLSPPPSRGRSLYGLGAALSPPLSPPPAPRPSPARIEAARDRGAESADPAPRRPLRRGAHAPARGEEPGAARGEGRRGRRGEPARRGRPPPGLAPHNPAPHAPQPGLAMAAPRPSPAISVSVSAPAFYAPQKKFAPVVAPKPKVNPFRPGDGEPLPAAGAQRAQMGRVGEIPPPPPEGMRPGGGLDRGGRRAGGSGVGVGGVWKGCRGGGWAQPPCPEQMFLPHRGAHGWEPGLLGQVQVPAWGWEVGMWGTNLASGSVFRSVTGAAPLLRGAPMLPRFLPARPGTLESSWVRG